MPRHIPRTCGLLLACALSSAHPCCVPSESVSPPSVPDLIWNDRIRPDGRALSENASECVDEQLSCLQRSTDPWVGHYETRDQGVVSEIYPELRSDLEAMRLPKSDCLWTPHEQPVRLSWEAVLGIDPERSFGKAIVNGLPELDAEADHAYGEDFYPANLRWFSFCRFDTPYDREWLEISQPGVCEAIEDECPECAAGPYWIGSLGVPPAFNIGCDDPNIIPFGRYVYPRRANAFDVDLRAAPYVDPRPGHNLCAPSAPGPSDASVTGWLGANCPVGNGLADACGDRCLVRPDRDATLSVHSVYYERTRALSPAIMTVKRNEPRRLVRSMEKPGASYVWRTPPSLERNDAGPPPPEAPSLRWVENFTPDVRVARVRILRINGAGAESALAPTRLRVLDPVGAGAAWECPGETQADGSKVFRLQASTACRKGEGPLGPLPATPTYVVANVTGATAPALMSPLTWQADLPGSLPASEVFIEFTVENQACQAPSCNALKVERAIDEQGRLQVGRPHFSVIEVTNVGPEPLRIGTVRTEVVPGYADARGDFGLEALCCPLGVPAPIELTPQGELALGTDFGANPLVQSLSLAGQPAYTRALDANGARVVVDGHSLEARGDPKFDGHRITYTDPVTAFSWAPTLPGGRRVFGEVAYRRRQPPFYVDPGKSFWVRVATTPRAFGHRRARLRIGATADSNPAIGIWTESQLQAFGIAGPSLVYQSAALSLPRRRLDAAGQVEELWALNVVVSNHGGVDMQRSGIAITGPDAGRFRVSSQHAPAHTVPPGHDEVFAVAYTASCAPPAAPPPTYGPRQYHAQLRVTTDGGDAVVELRGEWCPQPGP